MPRLNLLFACVETRHKTDQIVVRRTFGPCRLAKRCDLIILLAVYCEETRCSYQLLKDSILYQGITINMSQKGMALILTIEEVIRRNQAVRQQRFSSSLFSMVLSNHFIIHYSTCSPPHERHSRNPSQRCINPSHHQENPTVLRRCNSLSYVDGRDVLSSGR